MEPRIISLNVRLWTKENNPFKPHFWLWRTFKQAGLFRRENPDIICLQEVEKPVGRFLLGLWNYKGFAIDTRIPIFVKKSFLKQFTTYRCVSVCGNADTNGHGIATLSLYRTYEKPLHIQNCHYSWQTEEVKDEMEFGFCENTIFCGDMNTDINRFIDNLKEYADLNDSNFVIYPKTPEGPTYISYGEPLKYRGDIDQFGYVGFNPPKAEVVVLPDRVSDHFPILATIEI